MKSKIILLFCCLFLSQSVLAANARDFDKNRDGVIQKDEYLRFIQSENGPRVGKFDSDGDGRFNVNELTEVEVALRAIQTDTDLLMVEFEEDYPEGQAITEFAIINNTDDKDTFKSVFRSKLLVRKSFEDVRIGTEAKKPSLAGPAELQFTMDKKNDNKILLLKGTVMYPFKARKDGSTLVVPSMTLNRVTNEKEKAKEVNSLIFRIGGDWEFDPDWVDLAYFRVNPAWTTDTNFDLDIRGGDLQFEPVWLNIGQHVSRKLGPLSYTWRGIFLGELGKVYDSDDRKDLVEGENFSRLGGKLSLTLWPDSMERLSFNFDYHYLWKVRGDLRDRKLFKGSVDWKLDSAGHFKLQTVYTNGDSTVALEDEETWSIGLGVLY